MEEAEELLVQVVKISKGVLDKEHLHTLVNMGNLARIYHKQDRLSKA